MSAVDATEVKQEIIIVRRNRDDFDEGHHGGVWKIAFADFMTALMCFFLVMWLINAANEQTKASVASYFNPVKLVDRSSSRKGLSDLGDGPSSVGLTADDPQDAAKKAGQDGRGNAGAIKARNREKETAQQTLPSDEKLFANPYAVLAEIAMDTGTMQNVSQKGEGGMQAAGPATGASGGQSYRDPFAPDFWSQQVATPMAEASAERPKIEGEPAKPGDKAAEAANRAVKAVPPAPVKQAKPAGPETASGKPESIKSASSEAAEATQVEKPEKRPPAEAVKAAADVKEQIAKAFASNEKIRDGISVEATEKGVEISITDQLDFGMFEIGSALPRRELVLAMEKIGHIVNGQKGSIVIQGHTDARPFKSDDYDNWRLSTARAHSAYYMLVRGGVDDGRIKEVAGFADRQPKDKADPLAAVNRRIEILLETDG